MKLSVLLLAATLAVCLMLTSATDPITKKVLATKLLVGGALVGKTVLVGGALVGKALLLKKLLAKKKKFPFGGFKSAGGYGYPSYSPSYYPTAKASYPSYYPSASYAAPSYGSAYSGSAYQQPIYSSNAGYGGGYYG